jgi:hypothetical protein
MQMYHDFNKKYFGNRLPKDMVVHFKRMRNNHGVTMMFENRPLYILLDFKMRGLYRQTALTLLHEMVHVEIPKTQHGPKFHKRMLQLAKAGAFKRWW